MKQQYQAYNVENIFNIKRVLKGFSYENVLRSGGDGVNWQIDESMLRHEPKYHCGREEGLGIVNISLLFS